MSGIAGYDELHGTEEAPEGTTDSFSGLSAPDPYTLVVDLADPYVDPDAEIRADEPFTCRRGGGPLRSEEAATTVARVGGAEGARQPPRQAFSMTSVDGAFPFGEGTSGRAAQGTLEPADAALHRVDATQGEQLRDERRTGAVARVEGRRHDPVADAHAVGDAARPGDDRPERAPGEAGGVMDLTGKYLMATIKDASARLLFELPGAGPARAEGQWTFGGRVEGETAGVGVWLALDEIVPAAPRIEKVASGFLFIEGPVWVRDPGHLLFSDPNDNRIYRWTPDGDLSVFRTKSGYTGVDIAEYGQPGSNGLTLDRDGRLTIDEHGNRRVTRLEKNGQLTVLADRYEGKRLNSPNDVVYRSDGVLYFTDPPFGLPKFFDDPRKELPYSGVFRVADGRIDLVATDLTGPNGLAFSPDERFLYVTNWDVKRKVVMRYPVQADGKLGEGDVFFDLTSEPGEQALDGLKLDERGNLYVSAPGGVWIISPAGKHLGTIAAPEQPANFAWGDDDGRTLYVTALTSVYRLRLTAKGVRP